jgi:hypothetical protein
MKAIVDRLEGDMAVLLVDESLKLNVPIALLPDGVREGDILDISITIDEKATEDAKERVSSLMARLKMKVTRDLGLFRTRKNNAICFIKLLFTIISIY